MPMYKHKIFWVFFYEAFDDRQLVQGLFSPHFSDVNCMAQMPPKTAKKKTNIISQPWATKRFIQDARPTEFGILVYRAYRPLSINGGQINYSFCFNANKLY